MRTASSAVGWFILIFVVVPAVLTGAQVLLPPAYYASTTNQTGGALKAALHETIKGHTNISYSADTAALGVVDSDPQNSNNVILVYSGYSAAAKYVPALEQGTPYRRTRRRTLGSHLILVARESVNWVRLCSSSAVHRPG